jgi:hypothetical protein
MRQPASKVSDSLHARRVRSSVGSDGRTLRLSLEMDDRGFRPVGVSDAVGRSRRAVGLTVRTTVVDVAAGSRFHGDDRSYRAVGRHDDSECPPLCFPKAGPKHRGDVREGAGPTVDGDATNAIVLNYTGGVACPDDSSQDGDVTRDVLYVSRRTGFVVRRERYERESLVEEYALRDLRVDEELPDDLFR